MDNQTNNSTMEHRVVLEKQNKRSDQVIELILDNCRASQISGITDEFVNLEILSLINVGLVTLKGFPKLPKLRRLELSDNRLQGGLNLLHGSPKLQHLNISGNRIKDFEALEPLKEFHELANLDLYNCEVTKAEDYRKKVFDLLPKLHSLDGFDRDEREVADTDESDDEDGSNLITRDDNEIDDEEAEGENDDESDYDEEDYDGPSGQFEDEEDEDDDDDDDGEDDDDDDADDEEDDEEEDIGQNSSGDLPSIRRDERDLDDEHEVAQISEDDDVEEVDGGSGPYENDDDNIDEEDDEDDDDDDDDDDEEGESDLKMLQKDSIEEDSDDDDFEPNQEPEDRDHEIDPEDDGDQDNVNAELSTSKLDTTETNESDVVDSTRGQKRKFDDVGGDETAEGGNEAE